MTAAGTVQAFLFRAITTNAGLSEDGTSAPGTLTHGTGLPALDNFTQAARVQARRMGQVYELLYCLENSVRELVEQTLRERFGAELWWQDGVPELIRKGADRRRVDDLKARWHGPRGESPINYVDFPQYADIMIERWDLFEQLVGDRDWLLNYFAEMNRTRRALAHTGSLEEADVERMDFRVREWLRVVG